MKNFITFYPVKNGDTTLIKFDDGTTIQSDCKIRKNLDSNEVDVKKELLKSIKKKKGNPTLDVFMLTHADQDHCLGFKDNYYTGDPKNYATKNQNNDEIIIGELWVTSMIFSSEQCDDAHTIRNEANRRKRLYQSNSPDRLKEGNRLVIVGYDGKESLEKVPHFYPGDIVDFFNGKTQHTIEAFVHAPFKDDLITAKAEKTRNSASIVLQFRFFKDADKQTFVSRIILGGDSDHYIWEKILEKSKIHDNEHALYWDLFLSPHHCSWSYFNDVPYSSSPTPKSYSLEFLDYRKSGAKLIASSKEILDNNDNPPHYKAKEQYVKKVGESNFLSTAIYPEKDKPLPMEFEITEKGLVLQDAKKKKAVEDAAANLNANRYRTTPDGKLGLSGIIHQPTKFFGT
jgi:hypothetical protein